MTVKIEGMKDDLDVVAIVKAFEGFRDALQLIGDKADRAIVDLPFEASVDSKTHYEYKQDELVIISGIKVVPTNKKIGYTTVFGASDKLFYSDDAELINVFTKDDVTGEESRHTFKEHIDEAFRTSFPTEMKINSITALQAMIRNNPPMVDILNDPTKFLEEVEKTGARSKAYSSLEKFGRY